ncbi:HD domain-containing protein [Utexia brackfieldae]|uniref:HD domain-containing protein n=1 Tax=Utexia brackfieldae TaxID=3074108 RepID=UPI00370D269B
MLNDEQTIKISRVRQYTQQKLAHDYSGHDFSHIERVVNLCHRILPTEPTANDFVVLMSAYLHDVIDDKVVENSLAAKNELLLFLQELSILPDEQIAILEIIEKMSYCKNLTQKQALSLEGMIVQDADRLDAIGAIGIGRTFYYGGNKKNQMHDLNQAARADLTEVDYRHSNTVINHFYEKLFLLQAQMNTEAAKQLAQERHQFMLDFVARFEKEWLGDDQ